MASEFECPNCGAAISETETECRYCGSRNPHYQKPKSFFGLTNTTPNNQVSNTTNSVSTGKKNKFNILVFILLLFVFWPGAIIYLIFASK